VNKGQLIAIAVALVVTVIIYLGSRTPDESATAVEQDVIEEPVATSSELDDKVNQAVQIIQTGSAPPMQAVALLREVVAADSNHISANYWLGEFSMMSGQYDKAVIRFNKLCSFEPDNAEFCVKLARAYQGAGQTEDGIAVLNQFLSTHPDEKIKEQLGAVLDEMSVEL